MFGVSAQRQARRRVFSESFYSVFVANSAGPFLAYILCPSSANSLRDCTRPPSLMAHGIRHGRVEATLDRALHRAGEQPMRPLLAARNLAPPPRRTVRCDSYPALAPLSQHRRRGAPSKKDQQM